MSQVACPFRRSVPALVLLLALSRAHAALIAVDTTADEVATNTRCSLREAIRSANTDTAVGGCAPGSGADEIRLPAGTYTLTYVFDSDGGSRDLDVGAGTLTIAGAGAASTVIDGNGLLPVPEVADRVFEIHRDAVVTISGVTIRNGASPNGGGGIANLIGANLQLVDCIVADNTAPDGGGGVSNGGAMSIVGSVVDGNTATSAAAKGAGVRNSGALLIERSIVRANVASGSDAKGGGIANEGTLVVRETTIRENDVPGARGTGGGLASNATATSTSAVVDDSTIDGNSAGGNGGGIATTTALRLTNSTASGNRAGDGAGIHANSANPDVVLSNATVTSNSGRGRGGGMFNQSASAVGLANTILAGNVATGQPSAPDCVGPAASRGHNLVGDGTDCGLTAADGDQVGTATAPIDPMIDALADNGGPTQTHALRRGSPAIDAGDPQGCRDALLDLLTADQRGFGRPEQPGRVCDVGAFEFGASLPQTTTTTLPGGTVTTTTIAASPTTTTLPACSPASCDDGDRCTSDACTPGCTHTDKRGAEGLTCAYGGKGLQVAVCNGQKVPKAIAKLFSAASKQAAQAAATSGKKASKRAKRALASLKQAERAATKAKVSSECREALLAPIQAARRGAEGFLAGG